MFKCHKLIGISENSAVNTILKSTVTTFQSAYRPKHSTETTLVQIHEDLMQAVDSRRGVLIVLLDLSGTFNTLDYSTLLRRLRAISLAVLAWFMSYLVGRTNSIKIRNVISAPVIIQHVVPQGSVLGPLLFNIYLLHIADIFDRNQIRYHIYADDTQLYAECPHRITQMHDGKSTNA